MGRRQGASMSVAQRQGMDDEPMGDEPQTAPAAAATVTGLHGRSSGSSSSAPTHDAAADLDASHLSDEQKAFVFSPSFGNKLVLACAGSGKTRIMIHRILHMLTHMHCKPEEFFVTTFTKNGASNISTRLNKVRQGVAQTLYCGTFHSLALQVLDEYQVLPKGALAHCHVDEWQCYFLDFLRTHPKAPEFLARIKHVFVDEYQDVNKTQFDILCELNRGALSTSVIGDDNQNLFSFRGSDVKFIRQFSAEFRDVQTFFLSTNYRSSPPIVNLAEASITLARSG